MNNNFNELNINQTIPDYNQPPKKSQNSLRKVLVLIGGITIGIIILFVIIFTMVSSNSNKLICKSSEGNITIMYNDSTITGYTASNISYDMDSQKKVASQIGIDSYISQFKTWFETNTTGSCSKKQK